MMKGVIRRTSISHDGVTKLWRCTMEITPTHSMSLQLEALELPMSNHPQRSHIISRALTNGLGRNAGCLFLVQMGNLKSGVVAVKRQQKRRKKQKSPRGAISPTPFSTDNAPTAAISWSACVVSLFSEAIAWAPACPTYYIERAGCYLKREVAGDVMMALRDADQAIALQYDQAHAHVLRLQCLEKLGQRQVQPSITLQLP